MVTLNKIERSEALRYLGYRGNQPDENTLDLFDECEALLLKAAVPKYLYRYFDLHTADGENTVGDSGVKLAGESIVSHLKGCFGVVLMCATLSAGVDRLLRQLQATDMTKAVIADALGSAAIEQVCNMADEEIQGLYPDKYLTFRFSPGYGDLPLELQRDFLRLLDAQRKIGLTVSQSSMLIPTKSVSAIIGISNTELPKQKRGCAGCNMRAHCKFRKAGERCV